jgi:hypothetical protein
MIELDQFVLHQPLAGYWGHGTRSASDGMHVRVGVKAANADRTAAYFGPERGVTIYGHTASEPARDSGTRRGWPRCRSMDLLTSSADTQQQLVALTLHGQPQRRMLEQVLVGGFQPLAGHAGGCAQLRDGGALAGRRPQPGRCGADRSAVRCRACLRRVSCGYVRTPQLRPF